ncbi:hypothetical protein J5N97_017469 [Dioscorea zingiberensis]|uniref:Uncharacterized protein n=1 Tax=Dioscorea zingiberensis TaxID=325984 RepID=A0A9D5CMG8_9LILI|nr:hypothetical protein J5N97_017469 [Dioscorea zingiberensis]
MAVALRRIESRISRAPPPTPIVTGKGHRSAAIDDLTLSDYLETTLKVPDLTLPESYFPARSPPPVPAEICFNSLFSGDNTAARQVIEAATAMGAFRIEGGITKEELRAAIEAFRAVLGFSEEKRMALKLFNSERGEYEIQEFQWITPMSSMTENAWPESYPPFREKVEKFAAKLQLVAECIARILSDNIRNQRDLENISNKCVVLCLRKHGLHHSEGDQSDIDEHHHSHALSLHLSGDNRELRIRSQNSSSSFVLPPGSILVTIREELEEWCNGELKSANVESLPVQSDDNGISPFSLEFMCSPQALDQNEHINPIIKKVSVMDQLLILLVLSFLYKLWTLLYSYLTNT